MHTIEMALNMLRIGHLIECEIVPSDKKAGAYNVVTIAQQGQGGDRYLVTDDAGRVIECSTSYAKSVATRIGFQDAQIFLCYQKIF